MRRTVGERVRAVRNRLRWAGARRRPGRVELTGRQWFWLTVFTVTAMTVAVGVGAPERSSPVPTAALAQARLALAGLRTLPTRPPHDTAYRREEFGPAWTDAAAVAGAGNACDTRNDILDRDLTVTGRTATSSCPTAVASGSFTSPYTGRTVAFVRGRGSAAVQIDHLVPLSYAWDLGAAAWPVRLRWAFANDPANLVASDAASNQAKSDAEPARWMPPLRSFHCQYAVQFVTVLDAYGLPVDAPSRATLDEALRAC